jgi:hypothetical protein
MAGIICPPLVQIGLTDIPKLGGHMPHTQLISKKRFTNLKVDLKHLGIYKGAKIQLVSYEFEYFNQCIMTFGGLRDCKGPILMH